MKTFTQGKKNYRNVWMRKNLDEIYSLQNLGTRPGMRGKSDIRPSEYQTSIEFVVAFYGEVYCYQLSAKTADMVILAAEFLQR